VDNQLQVTQHTIFTKRKYIKSKKEISIMKKTIFAVLTATAILASSVVAFASLPGSNNIVTPPSNVESFEVGEYPNDRRNVVVTGTVMDPDEGELDIVSVTMPHAAHWAVVPGDANTTDFAPGSWEDNFIGSGIHRISTTSTRTITAQLVAFNAILGQTNTEIDTVVELHLARVLLNANGTRNFAGEFAPANRFAGATLIQPAATGPVGVLGTPVTLGTLNNTAALEYIFTGRINPGFTGTAGQTWFDALTSTTTRHTMILRFGI